MTIGIDQFQSLLAQQQQDYLNSIAQQKAMEMMGLNHYPSQYQSGLTQNFVQSANPDERLLVLLTEA